jgi:hypothetical protein
MSCTQKTYLLNSRRDLVSKFNSYKNINQLSFIYFLNFNFFEEKDKFLVVIGLGLFYLLTSKKGRISVVPRFTKSKNCNLCLSGEEALLFLGRFLKLSLKNVLGLEEGFSVFNFSEIGTFSFMIQDIYTFSELEDNLFKLRNLKNLNISMSFTSHDKQENIEMFRSLGFVFQN